MSTTGPRFLKTLLRYLQTRFEENKMRSVFIERHQDLLEAGGDGETSHWAARHFKGFFEGNLARLRIVAVNTSRIRRSRLILSGLGLNI